jgi:RNA polymerase sigma factor (sigma-70 family)
MLSPVTTNFLGRLRANDQAAWYELWETFGPVVQAQLTKWGKGRIGQETVRDLSQETLAALSESIDRFDPKRGVRFSTWLLSIAKHVLGDEMDRRHAQKRGGNKSAASLEEGWMVASDEPAADAQYEAAVFRAKVEAAIRMVSKESEFTDFATFRMRVLEGQSGKEVAATLGTSEPTVSRRVARVRDALRKRLRDVVSTYSFTEDETAEPAKAGLQLTSRSSASDGAGAAVGSSASVDGERAEGAANGGANSSNSDAQADAMFDQAIGEIYVLQAHLREEQAKKQR